MSTNPYIPTSRDRPYSLSRCLADAVLNLLFPQSCLICSAPLARQQDCGVCDTCWQRALKLRIREPWCPSCGLPYQNPDPEERHLCSACILYPPPFAGARSFGYYALELSRIVQSFKFGRRRNLAGLLAPLMATTFFSCWTREEFDLVVPVPLSPKRRRERGFNQAAVLGRALARHIAVPFDERTLARVRHTPPQVGLSDRERRHNVHGAFRCLNRLASGTRVLLIDDVMTTGATAASAAEALLEGGTLRVSVLTAARAVPGI